MPTAALVRGQCLGGAFELALWCGLILCEPSARFGVPETKLGVFPPVAAIALPWRVSGARATQIILSGDTYDAQGAVAWGLADRCTNDVAAALLLEWFDERWRESPPSPSGSRGKRRAGCSRGRSRSICPSSRGSISRT